jgi:hypothetical protein
MNFISISFLNHNIQLKCKSYKCQFYFLFIILTDIKSIDYKKLIFKREFTLKSIIM